MPEKKIERPARRFFSITKMPKFIIKRKGKKDPRRISKVYNKLTFRSFFINQFLDEDDYENDFVWKAKINELFGDDDDEPFEIEFYYIKENDGWMSRLMWKCEEYENKWHEVRYNTSSIFALNMCNFDDGDDYDESD